MTLNLAAIQAALPGQEFLLQKQVSANRGTYYSMWGGAGYPASAGAPGNTTTGLIPTNATTGAVPFRSPNGTIRFGRMQVQHADLQPGVTWLCDRLWHAGAFSLTSSTTFSITPTAITRPSGATDAELWLEIQAVTSGTTLTASVSYTNQAGTSGHTTNTASIVGLSAGDAIPLQLAAGDTGVKSVQSLTVTKSGTAAGTCNLVLLRRLTAAYSAVGGTYQDPIDWFQAGLPTLYADSCLFFLSLTENTNAEDVNILLNLFEA